MDTLRYCLHSSRMLLRSRLEYPSSFFWQTLTSLFTTGGELLAVLLLLDRFTAVGHWGKEDILLFFGVMHLSMALTELFGRGITSFDSLVRTGSFDTVLLRPRSPLLQVLAGELDPRRAGSALVGIAALCMASPAVGWTLGKALCLIFSVLGGSALLLGLFLLQASLCFFSVKSTELINALTYGGVAACQYPIDIYPRPLGLLFGFVAPFALTTHLPVSYLLGKPLWGLSPLWAFLSPLAGFAFFTLTLGAWRFGVRHYRSTGS